MPNLTSARAQRFRAYVERLTAALGHQDRHGPLRDYVTGLCLPGDRKSIEPMAARVDPRHVRARHQSMHHFIANAGWDDGAVLRVARETVLAALERHGPVAAWVVDDTGIPKKGSLCFAKTPSGKQVVDLSVLIRTRSQLDDHPPPPPASAPPLPHRRPSPARHREPGPAPTARRLQANGAPAEAPHDGSFVLGWPDQSLDRLATGADHRLPPPPRAWPAPPLPGVWDGVFPPPTGGRPAPRRRD